MPKESLCILIVDDDEGDRRQIKRSVATVRPHWTCIETTGVLDGLKACEAHAFDCAIVDYNLTGQDGLAGIAVLHERLPYMAIIMVTGQGDEIVATEAMKRGALDYMSKKHLEPQSIRRSIENAVAKASLLSMVAEQQSELEVFSQVLVHDLRSPIHSVLSFATLIEDNLREGNMEDMALYSRKVINGIERMAALIDTLRQYTNSEQRVAFAPLDMREVMADTLSNLDHVIRERRAQVTYSELPTVLGTPQIGQLLQNLIGNGIKYCEAEVPLVHVTAQPVHGNLWQFAVTDNGIGIPENNYQEVFEPFHRLRAGHQYEGTGLGLATCKKIVERHGGVISCQSKEGHGTTFSFTLKAA